MREDLIGYALAFVITIIVYLVNLPVIGPMIQADESSYLLNAAAMAGHPNDFAGRYYAGYSVFLVPAFWLGDTPAEVWLAVKAVNAVLFFALVMSLWFAAKWITPDISVGRRAGGVALVAVYPMWVTLSGYSFAQIAFSPFFLFVVLAFLKAVSGGLLAWSLVGLLSGLLYWIHPTAVAVLVAVTITGGFVAIKRSRFVDFLTFVIVMLVMVVVYEYGLMPWLHDRMSISGASIGLYYQGIFDLLGPLATWEGMRSIISHTGGHIFYLSIGSVGLVWLGFFSLWSKSTYTDCADNSRESALRNSAIAILLTLSVLGIMGMSALNFSDATVWQRLDHWIYGRYVEGVIAPVLLVGAMVAGIRKVIWAIPIALLAAALMSVEFGSYTHVGRFNISAFWQDFWIRDQGLWIWWLAGAAIIALVAIVPRRIGMGVIFATFVYSGYAQVKWHEATAEAASKRWDAALFVRDNVTIGSCVGFDHSGIDSDARYVFWFDFGFQLFDYQLQSMRYERWIEECDGPLFSYSQDLMERDVSIRPLAISTQGGPTLWEKGRLERREVYPISVKERSPALAYVLSDGWHGIESKHVWSRKEAELQLPVPETCIGDECAVTIRFSAYGASKTRPVRVLIESQREVLGEGKLLTLMSSNLQVVTIPLHSETKFQQVSIKIPSAMSPRALRGSADTRVLGVALYSVDLVSD